MGQLIAAGSMSVTDASAAQAKLLQVERSPAAALAEHSGTEDEIRSALTPEIRAALPAGAAWLDDALRPVAEMPPEDGDFLTIQVGRFIAQTGGGWTPEHREEWVDCAVEMLEELPAQMLLGAIQHARKTITFASEFVPSIHRACADSVAELRARRHRLARIESAARG